MTIIFVFSFDIPIHMLFYNIGVFMDDQKVLKNRYTNLYKSGNTVIQAFSTFAPKIPYFTSLRGACTKKPSCENVFSVSIKKNSQGRGYRPGVSAVRSSYSHVD